MSQAPSNDLSIWNLKTATDWKLAFLKVALPFIDLPSLENLSDEQKQNIARKLVLMVYRDFDDLAIERFKNQGPLQWQAFQPEFLEFVIQSLPERIKGYPVEAPIYLKQILSRSVLTFLNLSDITLSPSESELEGLCRIAAVALFKDSMIQGFWWLNFEAESFFEGLTQLTGNLPKTAIKVPALELIQAAKADDLNPEIEQLWDSVALNHRDQTIISGEKRSARGQHYRVIKALWNARGGHITQNALEEAVFGENDMDWPSDPVSRLQRIKTEAVSFITKATNDDLAKKVFPKKGRRLNFHQVRKDLLPF